MGAWGGGIFESDSDLDIIDTLSEEAGVELCHDLTMTVEDSRGHLDNGNFSRVFDKYKGMKETCHWIGWHVAGGNYFCVLLAAAATRVGAKITEEERQYLKGQYKCCGLMKEGIEQMGKALEKYEDGKPYKLEEPTRTAQIHEMAARHADSNKTGGVIMANHFGDRFFAEDKGIPDFAGWMLKKFSEDPKSALDKSCAVCKKPGPKVEEGKKLRYCSRCEMVLYCGRECQKTDWKRHKKDCAKLATEEAKAKDMRNTHPSINLMLMESMKKVLGDMFFKAMDEGEINVDAKKDNTA